MFWLKQKPLFHTTHALMAALCICFALGYFNTGNPLQCCLEIVTFTCYSKIKVKLGVFRCHENVLLSEIQIF